MDHLPLIGVISTPVVISPSFGAEITINSVKCAPTFDISALFPYHFNDKVDVGCKVA
jgi:hypothetical protein